MEKIYYHYIIPFASLSFFLLLIFNISFGCILLFMAVCVVIVYESYHWPIDEGASCTSQVLLHREIEKEKEKKVKLLNSLKCNTFQLIWELSLFLFTFDAFFKPKYRSLLIYLQDSYAHCIYTHINFVGASNLLWGLGQPNSNLVGLIKFLVGLTLIFG